MTHVLNGSVSDGTLTAAIVEFATALGQRRLGSASAEDDATTRRLSMSSASVLSVSVATFSPTPSPSPLPSMAPTPMPTSVPTMECSWAPTFSAMSCSNYHGGKLLATEDDCNGEDGTFYSEGCDEDSCGCCVQVGRLVRWPLVVSS